MTNEMQKLSNEIHSMKEKLSTRELTKQFVGLQVKAAIRFKRAGDFQNMDHALNTAINSCTKGLDLNMDDAIATINTMMLVAGEK